MKKKKNYKYKSKFEQTFGKYLEDLDIDFGYETKSFKYTKEHIYKADFICDNNIIFETKGYFKPTDRTKALDVRKNNPNTDIRFVFMSNNKIHKNSPMRYGDWCDKNGFKWCVSPKGELPIEWLKELLNKKKEPSDVVTFKPASMRRTRQKTPPAPKGVLGGNKRPRGR